ncbi:MAG TPA: peptidylprolyl isomerase [Ornithinibacter sp.]|nr:peptidylprolyl isomerase [Ornithinibacter sp.]
MTREQERARARRRYERQQATLAQRESDHARRMRLVAIVTVILLVFGVAGVLGAIYANDPEPEAPTTTAAGCELPPAALGTGAQLSLPEASTAKGKTYVATVTTNCGDIELTLDGEKAPQAVASFIELAKQNYYLNAPCHRLTTDASLKVLQCGDPTGTGQGTPGYGFAVENAPKDGKYPRGTLAMARTTDPKKGNGGQFFLVYGDSTLPDPDGYTVFGTVTSGLDIVDKIAAAGVAPGGASATDGFPAAPISILRVAVTEKKA